MTRISDLFDLQEIDLKIDSRRSTIDDIESRLGESEEIEAAAAEASERDTEVQELQKKLKGAEWEVDDLTNKIKQLEKKLYGGSVHIPKELASIDEDIHSFRRTSGSSKQRARRHVATDEAEGLAAAKTGDRLVAGGG
jgi:predicted  nucleic acid-binding Zn-ribbon protein